ncbi:MAG TPA: hypothetical protein VFT82_03980, partial [Candidatus Paceibacterota bacterium]|nr:hypothetical protein [Candidatus Paceibacterota bacterium]
RYKKVTTFAKPQNLISVRFMFRDLPNVRVIEGDDIFARAYIFLNKFKIWPWRHDEIKKIGFEDLKRDPSKKFEIEFYELAGVPFEKKWESFHIERDRAAEEILLKKAGISGQFAFVHDDKTRGYGINETLIPSGLILFRPQKGLSKNVFDYCGAIERAAEIHVIDSSFMFLIDCLEYDNPGQKLFVHRYARANLEWSLPILKKNWKILS